MIKKLWYRWILYWNGICPKHFIERKWDSGCHVKVCDECECDRYHRERREKLEQEQLMELRIATARKVLNGN